MKRLLLKTLLFLAALSILLILPAAVLVLGKEYASVSTIMATQKENQNALVGFVYNGQSFIPYKQALVWARNPDVISLGTSRVMQFRGIFFKPNIMFANAGGGAKNLYDVKQFMEHLPPSVSVVLLGLDEDMFTGQVDAPSYNKENSIQKLRALFFANIRKIYVDYAKKRYTLSSIYEKGKSGSIGLAAILSNDGFRADGSYEYGHVIYGEDKKEVANEINSIASNIDAGRYAAFKKTGGEEKNLLLLGDILRMAKEKNIYVIGVVPPYPSKLYEEMKKRNGYRETVVDLPLAMQDVFKREGFAMFNFTEASSYGGNEDEFVDSIHASDKSYARMLVVIAEKTSRMQQYVDVSLLRQMIQKEKRDLFTF